MLSKTQFTKQIGQNIKELRRKKGVSQETLAHKAGLYRTYIGHLENARYSPSGYVLYKIAKVLKINPSEFFPKK